MSFKLCAVALILAAVALMTPPVAASAAGVPAGRQAPEMKERLETLLFAAAGPDRLRELGYGETFQVKLSAYPALRVVFLGYNDWLIDSVPLTDEALAKAGFAAMAVSGRVVLIDVTDPAKPEVAWDRSGDDAPLVAAYYSVSRRLRPSRALTRADAMRGLLDDR